MSEWAPVISLYERFGCWPAVLVFPSLGVFSAFGISWKLMKTGSVRQ